MGNYQREKKRSYLDGLRRESTLLEDFVEPCKTRKINGAWYAYNLQSINKSD